MNCPVSALSSGSLVVIFLILNRSSPLGSLIIIIVPLCLIRTPTSETPTTRTDLVRGFAQESDSWSVWNIPFAEGVTNGQRRGRAGCLSGPHAQVSHAPHLHSTSSSTHHSSGPLSHGTQAISGRKGKKCSFFSLANGSVPQVRAKILAKDLS